MIIAGGGFALMAWEAACKRNGLPRAYGRPAPRILANRPNRYPCSHEYYRIIDRAQFWFDYWKPPRRKRFPLFL